jgi:hypothetical protein
VLVETFSCIPSCPKEKVLFNGVLISSENISRDNSTFSSHPVLDKVSLIPTFIKGFIKTEILNPIANYQFFARFHKITLRMSKLMKDGADKRMPIKIMKLRNGYVCSWSSAQNQLAFGSFQGQE